MDAPHTPQATSLCHLPYVSTATLHTQLLPWFRFVFWGCLLDNPVFDRAGVGTTADKRRAYLDYRSGCFLATGVVAVV